MLACDKNKKVKQLKNHKYTKYLAQFSSTLILRISPLTLLVLSCISLSSGAAVMLEIVELTALSHEETLSFAFMSLVQFASGRLFTSPSQLASRLGKFKLAGGKKGLELLKAVEKLKRLCMFLLELVSRLL